MKIGPSAFSGATSDTRISFMRPLLNARSRRGNTLLITLSRRLRSFDNRRNPVTGHLPTSTSPVAPLSHDDATPDFRVAHKEVRSTVPAIGPVLHFTRVCRPV